ncbi:MAG TPA: glutaredoxin family protein [Nitrospiraceae bacterium]|jgi:glutaredoxin|nr:glutaredoxin family protein [Nitrospiraceae bacterium]
MQPSIILYTLSTCRVCKATKKLLDELAVAYERTDVDLLKTEEQNAILEKIKAANPRGAFPTLIIGDTIIVGLREAEIRKALGL